MARSCLATTWFIFNGLSEYSKVISVEGETLCRAGGAVSKGREGARGAYVCTFAQPSSGDGAELLWGQTRNNRKGGYGLHRNPLKFLVGMTRFELATP